MLSKRSERLMYDTDQITKYSAYKALRNSYDPITNPEGIINLGTAVNGLMDDILLERFSQNNFFEASQAHFRYYKFWGSDEFLKKLAGFMTKFFKAAQPLNYENIFVLNGALLSLDILTSLIADEEDVILFPTPCYSSYSQAGYGRWNVNMCPIKLSHNKETGEYFDLTMEDIKRGYDEQIAQGKKVRGFLLNNPHNPLGRVFSKELVLDIMNFCQRNNLHLIADEVYCMSVFDEVNPFHSILQLKDLEENTLEKDRIHVYWGFSKDLCLTSYRTGVIHTENAKMKMAIQSTSQFQAVPLPVLNILENFITDLHWIEKSFIPVNHERLRKSYSKAKTFLDNLGICTTPTTAGFFFLADLRQYLNPTNEDTIKALVDHLYKHGIYITPSWEMKIPEPGWFRIVFSFPEELVEKGLLRLQNALEDWSKSQQ